MDVHPAYVLMGGGFLVVNLGFWPLFLQLTEIPGGMWSTTQIQVMFGVLGGQYGDRHRRRMVRSLALVAIGGAIAMCGGATQP